MVQDYGATVNTISGSVGPLYYCTVKIEGEPTRAMVDRRSSMTILNFSTFRELGKRARIPPSALKPPDMPLREYSQRPIPVGAMVELEIEFGGRRVTTPVYLQSLQSEVAGGEETCLLGTYVINPLGLISTAPGVEAVGEQSGQDELRPLSAKVCLVNVERVPGRCKAFLPAKVCQAAQLFLNLMENSCKRLVCRWRNRYFFPTSMDSIGSV